MLNVLIVDDEPLVRTGICHSIAWNDYGMQVFAEAGSVDQAIRLIEQNGQIDVVFTDMSMPNRNGLDLLRWLHENHPEITSVILSYHNEFSYVQEALRTGVVDYILKEELGKPKFCSTMSNIAEKAKCRQQQNSRYLLSENLQHFYYAVALFSVTQKQLNVQEVDLLSSNKSIPIGLSAWLLLYEGPLDHEAFTEMEQRYEDDVFILTFEESNITLSDLILCINTFISRDFYFVRLPQLRVYSLNAQKILEPISKMSGPEYVQLEKQLTSMQWVYQKETLEKILNAISRARLSPSAIFNLFHNVQTHWKRVFSCKDTPEMFSMANIHYWYQWLDWIQNFQTLVTTQAKLATYSTEVVSTIQNLLVWIDDNFMNDISLTAAANQTNLSPSYFSRCFKDITGCLFSNYIRDIRISYAKKMLECSNLPIRRIAELCGFSDQFYFDKVFKKTVGKTPGNYRRELLK